MELAFYSNYLLVDLSVLEAYSDIYAEISEMLRTPTNTACGPAIFFPWAAHFHCAVVDINDVHKYKVYLFYATSHCNLLPVCIT